jgi:8-oxo-dGTP pyrophosphatase MutT (NUDIX family)
MAEPAGGIPVDMLSLIRARLTGSEPRHAPEDWLVPGLSPAESQRHRALFPQVIIPAAVLIALVARAQPTVLLTQRARELRIHAGQISFPGGRIEPGESEAAAALREAHEEIGLVEDFVQVAGFLPDHILLSGFRVTPVVGIVQPGFSLSLAIAEVQSSFEVPLTEVFDPAHHRQRSRRLGELEVELTDIQHGERTIWGATAGMLLCLGRLALAPRKPPDE